MELDLPTPVSFPPSRAMHPRSHAAYPPPKFFRQSDNTFIGLGNYLSANPLNVKNVAAEYSVMEIWEKTPDWEIVY